jgi:hypothetical protein
MDKTEFALLIDIVLVQAHIDRPDVFDMPTLGDITEEKISQFFRILNFIFILTDGSEMFKIDSVANLHYFTNCYTVKHYFQNTANIWKSMKREFPLVITTKMSPARMQSTLGSIFLAIKASGDDLGAALRYIDMSDDIFCSRQDKSSLRSTYGTDYSCYTFYEKEYYKVLERADAQFVIFDLDGLSELLHLHRSLIPRTFSLNSKSDIFTRVYDMSYKTKSSPKGALLGKHNFIVVSDAKSKKSIKSAESAEYRADRIHAAGMSREKVRGISRNERFFMQHRCPTRRHIQRALSSQDTETDTAHVQLPPGRSMTGN